GIGDAALEVPLTLAATKCLSIGNRPNHRDFLPRDFDRRNERYSDSTSSSAIVVGPSLAANRLRSGFRPFWGTGYPTDSSIASYGMPYNWLNWCKMLGEGSRILPLSS